MSRLLPLEDRIVIRPDEAKKQTEAGIIIPEASQHRPPCGTVIAVGPGKLADPTLKKILGLLVWFFQAFVRYKSFAQLMKPLGDRFVWPDEVPDEFRPTATNAIPLAPGDKVLYGRYAGTEIEHDGEELLVIRVSDVITKIDE